MLSTTFNSFSTEYNAEAKDAVWASQSETFRRFWDQKIFNGLPASLTDEDIDVIVKILDRNGKGNTKDSEAVAKALIPQNVWRRMFHELCASKDLSSVISKIFAADNADENAAHIDELYRMNEGKRNSLTGPSGNAINAMLAAYDPVHNLSIISVNDRKLIIDHFAFPITFDFEKSSAGARFIKTNSIILEGLKAAGVSGSSRTLSCFCYYPPMKSLWKNELSVKRENKVIGVTIPIDSDNDFVGADLEEGGPRESIVMQALVADIGAKMGLTIWLPKADRSRVLQKWHPPEGSLLESLPLNYGDTAMKTIENIDVLWLNRRTIVRAFEVEHTTSIYSGLLRMADLLALLPNIDINLHIVAPAARREKVFEEIRRPVFSLLEGGALSGKCTFISYDALVELSNDKNLGFLRNEVLDKYSEEAE